MEALHKIQWFMNSGSLKNAKLLLTEFKYYYNEVGELKNITTGEGFKYTNEPEYDKLSTLAIFYIQELLTSFFKFKAIGVPSNPQKEILNSSIKFKAPHESVNIFVSQNLKTAKSTLLLIQGTGKVLPGIWSRSLILNQNLALGSVIPFVEFAQKNEMSCIIFNPNEGSSQGFSHIDHMSKHCNFVWKKIVMNPAFCSSKYNYIVAHSAGGFCMSKIFAKFKMDVLKTVKFIALTDTSMNYPNTIDAKNFVDTRVIHYMASPEKLGTPIKTLGDKCYRTVSAGHPKHEFTTGTAMPLILETFKKEMDKYKINNSLEEKESDFKNLDRRKSSN